MKFTLQLLFVSSFVSFLILIAGHIPISSYFSPQLAVIHTHTSSTSTHNFVSVSFCLGAFVTTSLSTFLLLFVPLSQPFSSLSSSQSSLSEPRLSHWFLFDKVVLYCIFCLVLYWCCVFIETVGSSHTAWLIVPLVFHLSVSLLSTFLV